MRCAGVDCDGGAVGDDDAGQDHKLEDGDKSDFSGGISNLYICKGEPGKVVEVEASGRKGDQASLTQVVFRCFAILAILCLNIQILKSGLGQLPGLHGKQVGGKSFTSSLRCCIIKKLTDTLVIVFRPQPGWTRRSLPHGDWEC